MNKSLAYIGIVFNLFALCSCSQLQSLQSGDALKSIGSLESLDVAKQVEDLRDDSSAGDFGEIDLSTAVDVGKDLANAITLSDEEINRVAKQAAKHSDGEAELAPSGSSYAKRLEELTEAHSGEQGLDLNFKAYLSEEVNAFALADGSIRIYSGLMDTMDDEELLSVIGHEIGHVKLGHSKSALQVAYAASAALKGAAGAARSSRSTLGVDVLGKLVKNLINAQYSQANEKEADDFGLRFMMRHRYNSRANAAALRKLAELGGEHGLLSSHPDPGERAERIDESRQEFLKKAEEMFGSSSSQQGAEQQVATRESTVDKLDPLDYE